MSAVQHPRGHEGCRKPIPTGSHSGSLRLELDTVDDMNKVHKSVLKVLGEIPDQTLASPHSPPSPATTFHRFPDLPTEVQLNIYEIAQLPHWSASKYSSILGPALTHPRYTPQEKPILVSPNNPTSGAKIFAPRCYDSKRDAQEALVGLMHVNHLARGCVLRTWKKQLRERGICDDDGLRTRGVINELLDPALVTPTTFPHFGKLPTELQLHIFELALRLDIAEAQGYLTIFSMPGIRSQRYEWCQKPILTGPYSGNVVYLEWTGGVFREGQEEVVRLMHVNRLARKCVLRCWRRLLRTGRVWCGETKHGVIEVLDEFLEERSRFVARPVFERFCDLPIGIRIKIFELVI